MCGIIGYLGNKTAQPILLEGLKRMEYRGYDSAGVAILHKDKIKCVKKVGKIANLEHALQKFEFDGTVGIAHTRWATHGAPSDLNAHPHVSCDGKLYIIHNGIIENYPELKKKLLKKGHKIITQTDTEILAHLIEEYYQKNKPLEAAVKKALAEVRGTYGLAVFSSDEPNKLIAARLGSPLVLGIVGEGEYLIASDVTALLKHTRQVVYLEDQELAVLTPQGFEIFTLSANKKIEKTTQHIDWDEAAAEKQGYPHFMLKEIMEQPRVVEDALRGRLMLEEGLAHLGGFIEQEKRLAQIKKIVIIACGTAYYAGMVGEYMIEEYAGISTEVEAASEFRYRKPIVNHDTAVIIISQSGETADTLAALREAKRKGALCLGIVNVVGSSIAREVDAGAYSHAGPEIGVASTKAFISQLTILALVTIFLGRQRGMSVVMGKRIAEELITLPEKIEKILKQTEIIKNIAKKYYKYSDFFFLGRKYNFPIAYEGALKLKEVSYIHAEGYGSGEMKHGPIALIDKNFPVVIIAPKDSVYEKNISNLQELKARAGKIIALATEGDKEIKKMADEVIYIPKTLEMLTPFLAVIPLQLFAYYCAVNLKRNIDQPRNLAKSVTVE